MQKGYASRAMQVKKRPVSGAKAKGATPSSDAPTVKDLQTLLRDAGLRSTVARIAVLEYFHTHGGQNSHAEIFDALGERGFDRATIYRILVDLADAKILSRTDLGDHVWRFELRRGIGQTEHTEEHPHFVCVDCGEVSCLPNLSIKLDGPGKSPKAVTKNKVTVQLKGLCDDCS
jgi:Fur family ferric uptake transcriptional regulator